MSKSIESLARALAIERTSKANMEADLKEVQRRCDDLQEQLFTMLENANLRAVKVAGVGTFYLNDLAWARITDKQAALAWAEANMPEIMTLNNMQLSMLVRAAIKGEGEMPAGVDFTTSRNVGWSKS